MITRIYNDGIHDFENPLELKPIESMNWLIVHFSTIEARDNFVSQFPKTMKVRSSMNVNYQFEPFKTIETPTASLFRLKPNKQTGEVNEGGNKRFERFYNAVQTELNKQKQII